MKVNLQALDREQVPEPYNTFERPYVFRTYQVPSGTKCQWTGCPSNAHAFIVQMANMSEEVMADWLNQKDEDVRLPGTYVCSIHYLPFITEEPNARPDRTDS